MSETNDEQEVIEQEPSAAPEVPSVTAGQLLREARAASGMHIGTLSLALKVPVKKLEAIEADDWLQLPDAVFVRALATSMCRQIKTDSAPILALLPHSKSFEGIDVGAQIPIVPSFHSATDSAWQRLNLRLSMPMILGAAVLLLAALLLIFLPDFVKQQGSKTTEVLEKIEPIAAPVLVPVAPPVPEPAPAVVAAPTPVTAPVPVAAPSSPVVVAPAVAALPVGMSILRLAAKGEVWVQVKDSKGAVLIQRNLQTKEVVNVSGAPPLSVVLGRVNEIESVQVRGKPFSLVGMSPDNVARFEVK
jgi:cytoskeleton protein RodZ